MSLVSSLEIIIIFGWAIPILIILYGITMFGYWTVYSYWFNVNPKQFRNRQMLKPMTKFTQSIIHGAICVGIACMNLILFVIVLYGTYRWLTSLAVEKLLMLFNFLCKIQLSTRITLQANFVPLKGTTFKGNYSDVSLILGFSYGYYLHK